MRNLLLAGLLQMVSYQSKKEGLKTMLYLY